MLRQKCEGLIGIASPRALQPTTTRAERLCRAEDAGAKRLDRNQVAAVQHLVSAAVPNLNDPHFDCR